MASENTLLEGHEGEGPMLPDDALIIIPVRGMVLFPGTVVPLVIGRERSIAAVQEAMRGEREVGLILQRDRATDLPGFADLHSVGTTAQILRYVTMPEEGHSLICQGKERFRVVEYLEGHPFLAARVERLQEPEIDGKEIEARVLGLKQMAAEAFELVPEIPGELVQSVTTTTNPGALADLLASHIDFKADDKQGILETIDLQQRLDKVMELLAYKIEVMKLSQQIGQQTREQLEQQQREYVLREQLQAIQKELGEEDEKAFETEELRKAIAAATMPAEAEEQAKRELKRLERIPEAAAEYSMIRTYLDWLIELPWSVTSDEAIDIDKARRTLDADHYGLEKVKKRILEHLSVRKLAPEGKSPILCFVGPPGVGKTSLGQSIARAMGRKFIRISLGGVHDEAEIRGHRRTYIGALPGNIIQALRKAGERDCVFMLDEMDKLGIGFHGDPSAALLEVLDPEQNSTFRDNYLGLPFDLSKVLFIGTANVLDNIPGPLRDRVEMIELPGYTEQEKLQIARQYLVDRQLEANGLDKGQCEITDDALRVIIHDHTREAGCRNLEREIGSVCRSVAVKIAEGTAERARIEATDIPRILGPAKFESEVAMRTSVPGVATGLAWTPAGGDILFVEASRVPGKGQLILTGHLGDVMKESAQAALSLVKSRATVLGLQADYFEKSDIHVHVPAGAIPKDGPSAGVAMCLALLSIVTNRRIRSDLAMTGEISLRGLVLPVGGIKEKVVAAARAGVRTVMLPARNKKDFDEIPEDARKALEFIWIERIDEAADMALCDEDRETPHAA